jgi:hypothetical protein
MSTAAAPQAAMPLDLPVSARAEAWTNTVRQRALLRSRKPPPKLPRPVFYAALLIGLMAHVVLFVGLYFAMRPQPIVEADVMHVEWLDAPAAEAALPEPEPKPIAEQPPIPASTPQPATRVVNSQVPRPAAKPLRGSAATAQPDAAGASEAPAYRAYNPDGSLNIPKDLADQIDAAKPQPNFIVQSTAPSPIMEPRRLLKIRPNHFAKNWVHARNENLLSAALSKLNDLTEAMTVKKDFTTPYGNTVSCRWIIVIAGCSWGGPPPPGGHPTEKWKPATVLDEE